MAAFLPLDFLNSRKILQLLMGNCVNPGTNRLSLTLKFSMIRFIENQRQRRTTKIAFPRAGMHSCIWWIKELHFSTNVYNESGDIPNKTLSMIRVLPTRIAPESMAPSFPMEFTSSKPKGSAIERYSIFPPLALISCSQICNN